MKQFDDNDIQELKDMLAFGTVSSVDKDKMTARAQIESADGIISGNLSVLQNTPLVVVTNKNDNVKWSYEAQYVTHDRELGLGETYKKEYPDIIKTKIGGCPTGTHNQCSQEQEIKIYPWLPYVGQKVVCLFLPGGDGDGFILGGI